MTCVIISEYLRSIISWSFLYKLLRIGKKTAQLFRYSNLIGTGCSERKDNSNIAHQHLSCVATVLSTILTETVCLCSVVLDNKTECLIDTWHRLHCLRISPLDWPPELFRLAWEVSVQRPQLDCGMASCWKLHDFLFCKTQQKNSYEKYDLNILKANSLVSISLACYTSIIRHLFVFKASFYSAKKKKQKPYALRLTRIDTWWPQQCIFG